MRRKRKNNKKSDIVLQFVVGVLTSVIASLVLLLIQHLLR